MGLTGFTPKVKGNVCSCRTLHCAYVRQCSSVRKNYWCARAGVRSCLTKYGTGKIENWTLEDSGLMAPTRWYEDNLENLVATVTHALVTS